MNWLGTQIALVDVAINTVEFALNWLLQSSLLLGIGLAMGRLLSRRGSAVQSVVYRTTMVAVLICPLATWGLSQAGVSGWSVELSSDWGRQPVDSGLVEVDELAPDAVAETADPVFTLANPTTEFPSATTERFAESLLPAEPSPITLGGQQTIDASSIVASFPAEESVESAPESFSTGIAGFIALGVVAGWLLVSLIMSARLATAWQQLAGLRRRAAEADEVARQACRELALALNVSTPEVLRSPCLPSPCLAGLRRPAVLLPEDDHTLSIREVLIHELAHLRRHDCYWNLLRQIATALFFFQPLLWVLSRRLEATAEEVCDDYVVHLGGDRHEYAHQLVDIAELSTESFAVAGVGIVSLRSMLASRVTRIMDTSRTLSTRVGNLLLGVVLVGGLVGTTIVGLVGVGSQPSQADVETIADEADATIDSASDDDQITIRGTVVDPDGKPFAGATIHIARWFWDPDIPRKPLATATSGANGQFEISYRKSQFNVDLQRPDMWKEVTVVATATGFGPAWVRRNDLKANEQPTLRLVEDNVSIKGQIVDLEGKPLSGVTVKIGGLGASEDENLDAWLDALRRGEIFWEASNRHLGKYTPYNPQGIPETIVTDQDGSFEFQGVGKERKLRISLEGPTIAYTEGTLVTRKMEPVVANDGMPNPEWSRKHTVYGANCQIAVHPTQPIHGVVKDAETGQPLPGVAVESYRMTERGLSAQRLIRVTSDDKGRFELVGMPKGPGKQIIAVPNDDQPYLMREFDVTNQPGLEPIEMTLELHRGVWISGRVTEKETGDPVSVRVHYLPYRTNPFAEVLPEFDDNGNVDGYERRYVTDDEGRFRIVGLPGPAIVGVECVTKKFPKGAGHEIIDGLDKNRHFLTYNNPIQPGKLWPTAMKAVDVSEDEEEVQLDFRLDAGRSVALTTVDQKGREIANLNVAGVKNRGHWSSVESATFDMVALSRGEKRTLLFHQEELGLGKALQFVASEDAPESLVVELEPCVTIRGQLVDDNQHPISGARIRVSPRPGGDFSPELKSIATDAKGRFEHVGVLPGTEYDVMAESVQVGFKSLAKKLPVTAGETIDLGTIDITSDERPEPIGVKVAATEDVSGTNNKASVKQTASEAVPSPDENSQEFKGQVVDPAGKPAAGADLYLVFHIPHATGLLTPTWKPIAKTDANGTFHFKVSPKDFGMRATAREFGYGMLVAVKEGFGFAWSQAGKFETSGKWLQEVQKKKKEIPPEFLEQFERMEKGIGAPLQLVADNEPIRGQIFDINGQPVVGARLTLLRIWSGIGDDLAEWRKAAAGPKADFYSARMKTPLSMNGPQVRSLVVPATTDESGKYLLQGIGQGRIAQLLIEGPGIESAKIYARTEAGEQIELNRSRQSPDLGTYIYHPAELTLIAGPSTAITGVVRDKQTQSPLAGVTVKSQSRHGEQINGWGQDFVRAVTDDQGRYRLVGMPIGTDNRIAAIAPSGDAAYFSMSKRAETKAQEEPHEIDFDLHRGVWVEGRITDKQTGEGLAGRLKYYVNQENPSYQLARSLKVDERDRLQSDDEGRFRIAALPGLGYITFMAHQHQNYPRANVIQKPDGSLEKVSQNMLRTASSVLMPQNYHLVAEISPTEDTERVELNLQLDGGNSVLGQAIDPEGKPINNFFYTGKMAQFDSWQPSTDGKFKLTGYDPESPRHVYIIQDDRNLAGHAVAEGEVSEDIVVQLQPAGKVKGQLVDKDGAPLANCELMRWSPPMSSPAAKPSDYHAPPLPRNVASSTTGRYETDEDGRFEISMLVPGVEYRLRAFDRSGMTAGNRRPKHSGPIDVIIKVAPGESKDLGKVRLTDNAEFSSKVKIIKSESPVTKKDQQKVIAGHIASTDGKPVADVHVAVIAMRVKPTRGGDLTPSGDVLAEGKTDMDGNYRLSYAGANSKTHRYANLIARKEGRAVAWKQLNLDETSTEISLELATEELIVGQLVDIEGQPAAGVKLLYQGLIKKAVDGKPSRDGVGYRGDDQIPEAWLKPVETDGEGKFSLVGIPAGYGVFIKVEGSNRFASQDILLNTGMPEQRGDRDGTYRSLVKNAKPGEKIVLPLAPVQLFEGTVTYEDTGEPAPHARLTIWASQQEQYGSMTSVARKANANGQYRISPNSGIRFGAIAYPPDGVAYLARKTTHDQDVHWQSGDRIRQLDMTLPRGVLVRGKVTEAVSGAPIAGVSVQYQPETANNPNTADEILTGWQAIQVSDEQGEFEIAVLPGPGRLFLLGPSNDYVIQETTTRQISRGRLGGERQYAHHIKLIDVAADKSPIEMSFELKRGGTVHGTLVDELGQSVDKVSMISWRNTRPTDLGWRGRSPEVLGGRFEMGGLDEGEEYPVYFLDAEHKLGATAMISAAQPLPRVVLQACGAAVMRFVDEEGKPVGNQSTCTVFMVARPGVYKYNSMAIRLGAVAADSDFISNIDRTNYPNLKNTVPDKKGRLRLPVLIPGATYRIITPDGGDASIAKEFVAESGKTTDLGDIVVEPRED